MPRTLSPEVNLFDLSKAKADYARGWWWSNTNAEAPKTFRDQGNGPEPVNGHWFGPFKSQAAAERDALNSYDEQEA